MASDEFEVDVDARLIDAAVVPRHGPYRWPLPVTGRVLELVEAANAQGARTNLSEATAAIVCAVTFDALELKRVVERYRTAAVRDVLLETPTGHKATFVTRGRGRPPGS